MDMSGVIRPGIVAVLALGVAACFAPAQAADGPLVPLGVAKVDITPEQPVRMYGYASRKTESEGIASRLKAAALAIGGDEGEGPAVLLTVDSGSVPAAIRDEVLRRVQSKASLKAERFMLCNSHNHSGPNLKGIESMEGDERKHLEQYADLLTDRLEEVVLAALNARKPGRLSWTQGNVTFAANRRVLKDGRWSGFGAVLDAPVDHGLPLLRVSDADGTLRAVVINYACHNTTLRPNFTRVHGDWAATAQEYIEADHPGVIALITIGCGADADPYPHGTAELCEKHGRAIADEVSRLLAGPFAPVDPTLTTKMQTLEIAYESLPPQEERDALAAKSPDVRRLLERIDRTGQLPPPEPYGIAAWTFGDDLAMVFLGNEVVVDYALRMRREYDGGRLWINAYANDVSYYVASDRLVKEGGYEVYSSIIWDLTYGRPERLQPSMEQRIFDALRTLLPPAFHAAQAP